MLKSEGKTRVVFDSEVCWMLIVEHKLIALKSNQVQQKCPEIWLLNLISGKKKM